jgi:hypothetical protein
MPGFCRDAKNCIPTLRLNSSLCDLCVKPFFAASGVFPDKYRIVFPADFADKQLDCFYLRNLREKNTWYSEKGKDAKEHPASLPLLKLLNMFIVRSS